MSRASPRGARRFGAACATLACASACSRAVPEGARSLARGDRSDGTEAFVGPARFVPDVTPISTGLVDVLPDGNRRFIVSGIRVVDHPDGSIDRAREILPTGTAKIASLPDRIGGGLVIYIVTSNSTQLWRAKS